MDGEAVAAHEVPVYYSGLHALLMEPPGALGTLHIDEIGVVGLPALAVAGPGGRVRHYFFPHTVETGARVINVLTGEAQLAVLFCVQDCALALYALDVEVELLGRGEDLRRRDVLSELLEQILGEVVLAQNPLHFKEGFGLCHSQRLYDFCQPRDVGLVVGV